MQLYRKSVVHLATLILFAASAHAQQKTTGTLQDVAQRARDSVVVVTTADRDGQQNVLGSGFVIQPDGLIATSLHVIGEARPIDVTLRDGTKLSVTEVYASDHAYDLALLRVDARELPALELAEEDALQDGQEVALIGHPLGLKDTIVSGTIAGEEKFGSLTTWQVAMRVEPGNSGGPLMDMQGKVHGVMAMKSSTRQPFGFAVKISQLRKLIDSPNPILMDQWQTIGKIDTARWTAKMGARWSQRRGRILVERPGAGFGGRALLLRMDEPPTVPFEVAVSVKLDDEAGAAGLVFHSDGGDRHYGFYPSSGRLRLTNFQGPSVYTWDVVREVASEHYRVGEWNEIKVRVEKDRLTGYVNGRQVVSVDRVELPPGRIGLCKFRQTKAEFRQFRFGKKVESLVPIGDMFARYAKELSELGPRADLGPAALASQTDDVLRRMAVLQEQARLIERQAEQKRALAEDLHTAFVCQQLKRLTQQADIDLLSGALWIARLDNPELEIDAYVSEVHRMADTVRERFEPKMTDEEKLSQLDEYLFQDNGFHGSRTDYYKAANSHLDRVIDDREGLPITLSVLYMALAKELGLEVVGIGLPGHFVVRHEAKPTQLIDVFHRGKRLSRRDADFMVLGMTGRGLQDADVKPAHHLDILHRMLMNLLGVSQRDNLSEAMLRYLEALVTLKPDDASMRGMRGVLRHQQGRRAAALEDIDWILERRPPGIDLEQVEQMRKMFAR